MEAMLFHYRLALLTIAATLCIVATSAVAAPRKAPLLPNLPSKVDPLFKPLSPVHKRQACVDPTTSPDYPQLCKQAQETLGNISFDDMTPEEYVQTSTTISEILTDYCQEECTQPLLEFYDCLGNSDALDYLSQSLCAVDNGKLCVLRSLEGFATGQVSVLLDNSTFVHACALQCTMDCTHALETTVQYLGCCTDTQFLANVTEVALSCGIALPGPCSTNKSEIAECIMEESPDTCADIFQQHTHIYTSLLYNTSLTEDEFSEDTEAITELLTEFCVEECVQPRIDYLQCLGMPEIGQMVSVFECGKTDGQFCQVQMLVGVRTGEVSVEVINNEFLIECSMACSNTCNQTLHQAISSLGCCSLAFILESYFASCGTTPPDLCVLSLSNSSNSPSPTMTLASTPSHNSSLVSGLNPNPTSIVQLVPSPIPSGATRLRLSLVSLTLTILTTIFIEQKYIHMHSCL